MTQWILCCRATAHCMSKWRSCDRHASGYRDTSSEGRGSIRSMWRHLSLRLWAVSCICNRHDCPCFGLPAPAQCKLFLLLRNAVLGLKKSCSLNFVKLFHWGCASELWLELLRIRKPDTMRLLLLLDCLSPQVSQFFQSVLPGLTWHKQINPLRQLQALGESGFGKTLQLRGA